jgi:Lrp/AsnC family leucine-responsive transcriptional regulator
MRNSTFDPIDRAILAALQEDGRLSNVELAERVGLSQSACLRRVRQLEERGVIEDYVAVISQSAAGRPQNVFVQITLEKQQNRDLEAFEKAVVAHPQVLECYLMSGDSDYLLRVIVADASDYERLHNEVLTRLPGVQRLRSSFALRTVMKRTAIPLDRV